MPLSLYNTGAKRFAIIVDEFHSLQTGDTAKKLNRALADTEKIREEYAESERQAEAAHDELAAQGFHENMSFFAFTATPKD